MGDNAQSRVERAASPPPDLPPPRRRTPPHVHHGRTPDDGRLEGGRFVVQGLPATDVHLSIYVYIHTSMYMHTYVCMYIYIYIEREREEEGGRKIESARERGRVSACVREKARKRERRSPHVHHGRAPHDGRLEGG